MTLRAKTCKGCGEKFQPVRPMQSACKPTCAVTVAQRTRAKKERAELREAKQKAKTRSQWIKETQAAVNAYVRTRDAGKPCISCGSMPAQKYGGTMDCGHYRSTGSAPHLRFVDANMAAQCVKCNRHRGGMAVEFRKGLIARIGLQAVEALEADQEPRKYSIEDLKALKAEYTRKRKALEADKC